MDIKNIKAFRFINSKLTPIKYIDTIEPMQLKEIDKQKSLAIKNTEAFVLEEPFLNMLLWGERGCGKSSIIKMLLGIFMEKGLRIIELRDDSVEDIYNLYDFIRKNEDYKFIIFFDDISFDEQDSQYRRFKSIVEGGIEKTPNNVMFAVTSNKRHLINDKTYTTGDIYKNDEINEQMSLYGRFGLIIGFYPLSKKQYLNICRFYIEKYGIKSYEDWEKDAETYAIQRGGRSGRIAKQFAIYTKLRI